MTCKNQISLFLSFYDRHRELVKQSKCEYFKKEEGVELYYCSITDKCLTPYDIDKCYYFHEKCPIKYSINIMGYKHV